MFTTNLEKRQLRLHVVIFNQYSVSAPNASTDSCINFIIVINNSLLLKQAFSHEYYWGQEKDHLAHCVLNQRQLKTPYLR